MAGAYTLPNMLAEQLREIRSVSTLPWVSVCPAFLILKFLNIPKKSQKKKRKTKSDSHLLKICFYLRQWNPFKLNEKCFLLHVESSFFIEIFTVLSWIFTYVEIWFDNKATINFKIYGASENVPNISRSKGNPTIKFGKSIEYNIRNIFLEKSYTKCDRETSF